LVGYERPPISTLGMFVYDLGENENSRLHVDPNNCLPYAGLKRTLDLVRDDDFMGDAVVQMARLKRKFKVRFEEKDILTKRQLPR
jgi:hypothetical protein